MSINSAPGYKKARNLREHVFEEHPLACPKCRGHGEYGTGLKGTSYKGDKSCVHCRGKGFTPMPMTELYWLMQGPISWHKVPR